MTVMPAGAPGPQNPAPDLDGNASPVSGDSRRQLTTLQKLGVAGLVMSLALGTVWLRQAMRAEKQRPEEAAIQPLGGGDAFHGAPQAMQPPPQPAALPMPAEVPAPMFFPQQQQAPQQTPAESGIFAFSGGGGSAPAPEKPAAQTTPPAALKDAVPKEETGSSPLGDRLHPTLLEPTKARLLPHPDFLLTKGTIIPCILETAIDTQLAGFVKCVTPRDTRSTTGNVVVLDKGSLIVGEIQRGLQNGEDRVFVLWDRVETPEHAVVTLASPGTDELGRSGLPGAVDTHFWDRFGAAIMLSVVQTGLQAGSNVASNGNSQNGVSIQSFQSNGQELANTALVNSINIAPTLTKNQGDTIAIFVARDLDFSDIYTLRRDVKLAKGDHAQ
jgi:type IV secretion system protein VirB10